MGIHDALFKQTFSVPEHAADELRCVLPAAVVARIDWSSLELEAGSFVDDDLRDKHTDLLFSAHLDGRRVLLYLLFEHWSEPDRWAPLRLLGYQLRIWERERKRRPERGHLPVIVPVVLHHGESGWVAATSMRELYDSDPAMLDALGELVPTLRILVDDLARVRREELETRPVRALVLLVLALLRDARALSLGQFFARWAPLFLRTRRDAGIEALIASVRYLGEVHRADDERALVQAARLHAGAELEEIVMNLVDKIEARGRVEGEARGRVEGEARGRVEGEARGRVEGEARGRAETVLKLLALRFGAPSTDVEARVRSATVEELDRFTERLLSAASASEVVA